jgi:hypothetical protein
MIHNRSFSPPEMACYQKLDERRRADGDSATLRPRAGFGALPSVAAAPSKVG